MYLPTIDDVRQMTDESGLLYIGDSKMSAIEIRAELARKRDFYLVPLAKVGGVPALYEQCLAPIVSGSQCLAAGRNGIVKGEERKICTHVASCWPGREHNLIVGGFG